MGAKAGTRSDMYMARVFPVHAACWRVTHLLRDINPAERALLASSRLVELAPGLPHGSHLTLVLAGDGDKRVSIEIHADIDAKVTQADIDHVAEGTAVVTPIVNRASPLPALSELTTLFEVVGASAPPGETYPELEFVPPAREPSPDELRHRADPKYWPLRVAGDCMDLVKALASCEAQVRVHMAPSNELEQEYIAANIRQSVQLGGMVDNEIYLGTPVRIRCFVGTSEPRLPPRLRAALLGLGVGLRLKRCVLSEEMIATWDGEETSLAGAVQPFGMARCLVPLPAHGPDASVCGIRTREAETAAVPLVDAQPPVQGLRLGSAVDELGDPVEVRLGVHDLLLHCQVLGATGTGKSSLLAGLVQDAAKAGYGVTVLDAHGPLVDRVLAELPAEAIDRTIAIHCADVVDPVPVNVLACDDADLIIEVMMQVLTELFDPRREGIVGPRFERVSSQIIRAQQALIGREASFATIPMWLRDRDVLAKLVASLRPVAPDLAESINVELLQNRSNEFTEVIAWVNSKYERLSGSTEMRSILLTGHDAVDVTRVIDDGQLLLVDLASTQIGPLGAQFLGEMWLAKHWLAMSQRSDTSRPHLLIVDEAQLFGSGILPRMLAEARKFGIGVTISHQHLEQLSSAMREAALATTNNVIVFRSGPREAATALTRLGGWPSGPLTRLPRLTAAATLSAGTQQTQPFTLFVDHNERAGRPNPQTARQVLASTTTRFADPYRSALPWSVARVDALLDKRSRRAQEYAGLGSGRGGQSAGSSFLDEWLAKRKRQEQAEPDLAPDATGDE